MKRIILAALLGVLVGGPVSAAADNSSTKYVSADFGFTISLPEGWTFKKVINKRLIEFYAPYPSGDEKGWVLIFNHQGEWDMPLETAALTHSTNFRNHMMRVAPVKITVLKTHKTPLASGQFAVFIFEKWQSTEHRNAHLIRINAYTPSWKKTLFHIYGSQC